MSGIDLDKIARRVASGPGSVRTAGKIEFVKDQGPIRRDLRAQGFEWSPDALRNLAKIHWAIQRGHSYSMAALRLMSKMPSSQFSPDGLLGGRGYIQAVKDMRNGLGQAVEVLSSFADTVYDEINADHWNTAGSEDAAAADLVQDAAQVKANPEEFVDQEYKGDGEFLDPQEVTHDDGEEEEEEPIENPDPDDYNPEYEAPAADDDEDDGYSQIQMASAPTRRPELMGGSDGNEPKPKARPSSQLPTDSSDQGQGKSEGEILINTTTPAHGNYASAVHQMLVNHELKYRRASSIEPSTLPGPRVEHIGPGETVDNWASDDPTGEGLSSGTNESTPLLDDWTGDGVTGYDNVTDGDSGALKVSSRVARECYSWLPGANNDRNLNYYERGLTDEDVAWMRQNAAPEMPPGIGKPPKVKPVIDHLWDVDI